MIYCFDEKLGNLVEANKILNIYMDGLYKIIVDSDSNKVYMYGVCQTCLDLVTVIVTAHKSTVDALVDAYRTWLSAH